MAPDNEPLGSSRRAAKDALKLATAGQPTTAQRAVAAASRSAVADFQRCGTKSYMDDAVEGFDQHLPAAVHDPRTMRQ